MKNQQKQFKNKEKTSWSFKSFNGRGTRINCRTFSKNIRNDKIKNQIDKVKKWEDKIKRKDLKHDTGKYKYNFQQYDNIS